MAFLQTWNWGTVSSETLFTAPLIAFIWSTTPIIFTVWRGTIGIQLSAILERECADVTQSVPHWKKSSYVTRIRYNWVNGLHAWVSTVSKARWAIHVAVFVVVNVIHILNFCWAPRLPIVWNSCAWCISSASSTICEWQDAISTSLMVSWIFQASVTLLTCDIVWRSCFYPLL